MTTSLLKGRDSRKQVKKRKNKLRTKPAELGAFRKLPTEVRLSIWQYLMPEDRDEPESTREPYGSWTTKAPRNGNRLAILRTSHVLKEEVEGELYRKRELRISIKPRWKGWRAEGLPGSRTIDFANTEFAKFESIKVEIHCSEKGGPGQLLYARAAVLDLVCALKGLGADIQHCEPYSVGVDFQKLGRKGELGKPGSLNEHNCNDMNVAKIPKLQIVFLNTDTDTWHEILWHEDLSIRATFGGWVCPYNDLGLLLAPFGYLFNVQQIEFEFPKVLSREFGQSDGSAIYEPDAKWSNIPRFLELCQYVRRQNLSKHLFVLDMMGPTQSFYKAEIGVYLFLDFELDTAPGPTAAILRRERLIHNRWYRETVERILDMHWQYTKDDEYRKRLKGSYRSEYQEAVEARYRDFGDLDRSYLDHGWKLHVTQDPKWLEEWRRYWPTGIPPKGSPGWDACIATARR